MSEKIIRKIIKEHIASMFEDEFSQFDDLSNSGEDIKKNIELSMKNIKELISQKKIEKNAAFDPKQKAYLDHVVKNYEDELSKKSEDLKSMDSMKTDIDDVRKELEIQSQEREKSSSGQDSEITGIEMQSQT